MKTSPTLKRLIRLKGWQDSYRSLHSKVIYSHYYENMKYEGASRIDRIYHQGDITPVTVSYESIAFSDHMGIIAEYTVPDFINKQLSPRFRPRFKITEDIIKDEVFTAHLNLNMQDWEGARQREDLPVLSWWEEVVKPGIRRISKFLMNNPTAKDYK